jgi:predicted  nucleic acid-binding Zn-ribbon protein
MLPEVETLLVLQDRDQKLRRLRLDVRRAPQAENDARARLASEEAAVAAAKEASMVNEVATKNLDIDIETRKTSIARLKLQQFETRKNEEYRALEHEIERYSAEVTRLEDAELELMEKGEELKKRLAAAQERLAATRKLVEEEVGEIGKRTANAGSQIAELEAERKEIAAKVDPDLRFRYDRIFDKKAPAVVPLENGICGGCRMKVTASTLTAVKAGKVLTNCEQCGRILFPGE